MSDALGAGRRRVPWINVCFPVAAVLLAVAGNDLLGDATAERFGLLPYLLVIAVTSVFLDVGATLLAVVLSAIALWLGGMAAMPGAALGATGFLATSALLVWNAFRREADRRAIRTRREWIDVAEAGTGLGVWELDVASGALEASPGFFRLFDRPPVDGPIGSAVWREWIHADDRLDELEHIRAALERGERDIEREFRAILPDGRLRPLLARMRVDVTAGGVPSTLVGVTMHVLDRPSIQQALLASIVESSEDAIVSKTLSGRVTSWNAGAMRLFGWQADEIIGESIMRIILPELHGEEDMILARLRAGERIEHYETERIAKDGSRREVSLTISPVRDALGRVVGASKVARDVSSRRRQEAERRDAERRKDEFLALLSHELRNPLAPIRHVAKLLQDPRLTPAQLHWGAGVLARQSAQMASLLDDLLSLSRITRGTLHLKPEALPLGQPLQMAIEATRPLVAERGQVLDTEGLEPAGSVAGLRVRADPVRLAQVFTNLLNNASRYTPVGGRLRIRIVRRGNRARVEVEDDGIGLAAGDLERVFEMFWRGSGARENATPGLGIGLGLARQLVELHGGRIEAASAGPGCGSTFSVELPLLDDAASAAPPAA